MTSSAHTTWSVCPVCLKRIPAVHISKGSEIFLRKSCNDHGSFETIIWRGLSDFKKWNTVPFDADDAEPNCPEDCGLCSDHLQKTCCVIYNVTSRCNLSCDFCVADTYSRNTEPTLTEITLSFQNFIEKGKTLVQLSGGEPTMRDDLPEIVRAAREAGAKYIQLNTNGIRLANDERYVQNLADAGLSFVFMQFDGTEDEINIKIRNRPLILTRKKAIENCASFNLGVTLVPTLVRSINTGNIGDILDFAIDHAPVVRGVHFQPATFSGAIPAIPANHDRFTLDELVHELQLQSKGMIGEEHLLPSCCDHPLCGFHGDFIVHEKKLVPLLKRKETSSCCCDPSAAEKNREFVGRRWLRPENSTTTEGDLMDMDYFLQKVKTHGFTITAMAFQDAGNLDISRLRRCSLHVFDTGKMIPFCSYFLTSLQP